MLKTRIIPTLLYRDFGLVKGRRFDSLRAVGSATQAIKVYEMRGVDELMFLDVTATRQERGPDLVLIDELADDCFMPLTVGGGVRDVDDVGALLAVGADKVCIGTVAVERPEIVREGSERYGAQCIVVSIDAIRRDGRLRVCTHSGTRETELDPVEFAVRLEELGAGEILLQSVDRDGMMEGYDLELIESVTRAVNVPVIASGGCGGYDDMLSALKGGASAVAAASIFHFTEQTPREAKDHLGRAGLPVRL
jgi:cyclase